MVKIFAGIRSILATVAGEFRGPIGRALAQALVRMGKEWVRDLLRVRRRHRELTGRKLQRSEIEFPATSEIGRVDRK